MNFLFPLISTWLLLSQAQYGQGKAAKEILPDYVKQLMERVIQPVLLEIIKLRQIKIIAEERDLRSKQVEHCTVLMDELSLQSPYLEQAKQIISKLNGYLSLYTTESKKCESQSVISSLTCYLNLGKRVTDIYSVYEGTRIDLANIVDNDDEL
uniref:Uncharacterized protein n=1 Tax=Rhodnius prolixus TaxID=13249 RepID=T1HIL8_RHOPR